VILWNATGTLQKIKELDLTSSAITSVNPKATSVCLSQDGCILVGTRGAEIVEFDQ
jgi:hypothetical protein